MTIPLTDKRFTFTPLEEVVIPKNGYKVILDHYWELFDGNVLGFKSNPKSLYEVHTPQCNVDRNLMLHLKHPESEVVFIKVAYWQFGY